MKRHEVNQVETILFKPNPVLEPWISCYMFLVPKKIPGKAHLWTIMPDGSGYLIFHLYENWLRLSVVGPRSISENIDRKARKLTFIVKFKPGCLSGVIGLPVAELRDLSIPLESIWGREASNRLQFQLQEALEKKDFSACINSIEKEFYIRLNSLTKPVKLLEKSIGLIESSEGGQKLADLFSGLTISDRYLRYLFNKHVGISPKRYARILRVLSIIKKVDSGVTDSWSELAFDSNYYDQAHLIDDFNLLLGESPEKFIHRTNREEII